MKYPSDSRNMGFSAHGRTKTAFCECVRRYLVHIHARQLFLDWHFLNQHSIVNAVDSRFADINTSVLTLIARSGSLFAVFLSGEPSDRKWLHCILSQPVDNACKTDGGGVINTTVTSVEPMNDIVVFEIVLYGQQSRLCTGRRCKKRSRCFVVGSLKPST